MLPWSDNKRRGNFVQFIEPWRHSNGSSSWLDQLLLLLLLSYTFFASCPTYRREHFFFLFLFSFGIISVIINFRARKSSAAPYTTFLRFLPLMNQVRGMILKRRYRIRLPARRISPRHDSCGCREEETCACERVATSRSQVVGRMAAEGGSQSFDSL